MRLQVMSQSVSTLFATVVEYQGYTWLGKSFSSGGSALSLAQVVMTSFSILVTLSGLGSGGVPCSSCDCLFGVWGVLMGFSVSGVTALSDRYRGPPVVPLTVRARRAGLGLA